MLEEKFAVLKSFRQLLPDRLLDHAGSREADQRAWLCDVQITKHREARRDAAGRRIREHRHVRQPRSIEPRQGGADLGHLHEGQRTLHHPGAARAGHDDERHALGQRALHAAGNFLAHDDAHASANEAVLHGRDDGGVAIDPPGRDDDGILEPRRRRSSLEPGLVRLGVLELERVRRRQHAVVFGPLVVEERVEAISGAQPEVKRAFRADTEIRDEVLLVEDLHARRALHPQPFGYATGAIGVRFNRLPAPLEPRHENRA